MLTKTVLFLPSQSISPYVFFLSYCIDENFQYKIEKEWWEYTFFFIPDVSKIVSSFSSWQIFLCVSSAWGLLSLLDVKGLAFINYEKIGAVFSSSIFSSVLYFFCPLEIQLSFGDPTVVTLGHLKFSRVHTLFIFFPSHFLCIFCFGYFLLLHWEITLSFLLQCFFLLLILWSLFLWLFSSVKFNVCLFMFFMSLLNMQLPSSTHGIEPC